MARLKPIAYRNTAGAPSTRRRTPTRAARAAAVPRRTPTTSAPPVSSSSPSLAPPQDWEQALQNEPIYTADRAQIAAQMAAAQAKRDAAVKALMFQYNDPSNPYSTAAQLLRQEKGDTANMTAQRAARGVLSSGGTKLGAQDIGYNYGKSMYDALNSVNEQIGSLDQNLADQQYAAFQQQQQDLADAQQRLLDAGYAPSVVAAAAQNAAGGNSNLYTPGGKVATGTPQDRAAGYVDNPYGDPSRTFVGPNANARANAYAMKQWAQPWPEQRSFNPSAGDAAARAAAASKAGVKVLSSPLGTAYGA